MQLTPYIIFNGNWKSEFLCKSIWRRKKSLRVGKKSMHFVRKEFFGSDLGRGPG